VHALLSLQAWALDTGLTEGLAVRRNDAPPLNQQRPIVIYDTDEIEALLAAAGDDTRWRLFLLIMFDSARERGRCLDSSGRTCGYPALRRMRSHPRGSFRHATTAGYYAHASALTFAHLVKDGAS
jgi:hypothetical protein